MFATLRCVGWSLVLCGVLTLLGCDDEKKSTPLPDPSGPDGDGGTPSERASIADGDAVFFVGNSFFMTGSRVLPEWVTAIGEAVEPKIAIKTGSFIVPGSNHLSWFLEQDETKRVLAAKQYKVYVIQGDEREPVDDPEGFKQAVRGFHTQISAANGKMMLFMTWNLALGTDFYDRLLATFQEISRELDIPIIPAGQVYDDCERDPYPGYEANTSWLTEENLHQNEIGSAVNAYATFALLTGVDPDGVQFEATGQSNSAELLKYLSDKAWARVDAQLPAP